MQVALVPPVLGMFSTTPISAIPPGPTSAIPPELISVTRTVLVMENVTRYVPNLFPVPIHSRSDRLDLRKSRKTSSNHSSVVFKEGKEFSHIVSVLWRPCTYVNTFIFELLSHYKTGRVSYLQSYSFLFRSLTSLNPLRHSLVFFHYGQDPSK